MTAITHLRCERATDPLGIDAPNPRLGWRLETDRRGARQVAYRVVAGREPGAGDLWDSGRVESDACVDVEYEGTALASGETAYWRVHVWDETGGESQSEVARWEAGLLSSDDWQAEWIGAAPFGGPRTLAPAPYLRKSFALAAPVRRARLYVTALGLYEARINGRRVGDQELAPGWTDYNTRVRYQTYDVTDLLQPGDNALGAILGDGWYAGHNGWRHRQFYGDRPRLLAQLVVEHEDGSTTRVASDGTWKTAFGPILAADLLMGEHWDGRRDLGPWDRPGYDEAKWVGVETFPAPGVALVAPNCPPIRVTQELPPTEIKTVPRWPSDEYLVDFGQNMVGRIRLRLKGKAGETVRIRHGEVLDANGKLYTENLRGAQQTDYYTLRGDAEGEVFEPKFTFHGFRYVEIQGLAEKPAEDEIVGVVMHSDYAMAGTFACSDPLLNQLQHNIEWGWRGNSLDVPTDCPQRDERLGWTGDAQVFARTASFLADVATFFEKYEQDLEDSQNAEGAIPCVAPNIDVVSPDGGPAWADAFVICPWTIYLCFGDRRILERHYGAMRRFVAFLGSISKDYIRSWDDYKGFHGFGDWLSINADTPNDLIGTAFYAYSTDLLAKIAEALGHEADAAEYRRLFDAIRAAFVSRFVTPQGLVVSGTQTAYVLALHFGLMPDDLRPAATEALVNDIRRRGNKLSTGFVGSSYLNPVLTANGRADVAFDLLNQTQWPSWLYAVTQGATTIWERWDGWTHDKGFQDAGMNSFNHYAYGAIGAWLYQAVAGIDVDPAQPGYKHIVMKPHVGGGLTEARATYESGYGRIESAWRVADGRFEWEVVVPPNATATAHVPGADAQAEGAEPAGEEAGRRVYRLQPGRYTLSSTLG